MSQSDGYSFFSLHGYCRFLCLSSMNIITSLHGSKSSLPWIFWLEGWTSFWVHLYVHYVCSVATDRKIIDPSSPHRRSRAPSFSGVRFPAFWLVSYRKSWPLIGRKCRIDVGDWEGMFSVICDPSTFSSLNIYLKHSKIYTWEQIFLMENMII